jgi:NDP-sugar pyrophosphorylase family protein
VCVLAGGLGTRLGELVRETPKPLLEVAGQPFLIHQLRLLAAHGVSDVVLCVGYRGEAIAERIGTECCGVRISYSHDGPDLDGTLGAVRRALPLLGARFLILYGDTYLRIDYAAVDSAWRQSGLPALMTVLRNNGRWGASNATYADGRVLAYDKRSPAPETLDRFAFDKHDLADLFHSLAENGLLHGFEARERFFEIGTPAALAETDAFLRVRRSPAP